MKISPLGPVEPPTMDQDNRRCTLRAVRLNVELRAIQPTQARLNRGPPVFRGRGTAGRSAGFEEKAQDSPDNQHSGEGPGKQPDANHQVQGRVVEAEVRIEIGPLMREIVTPGMSVPPVADQIRRIELGIIKQRSSPPAGPRVRIPRFRIVLQTLLDPTLKSVNRVWTIKRSLS
jgi:hypothetical protein